MNKYEKLLNNSILFFIGNFGSKLINLLMIPLYTNKLSTSEYGVVDLSIVTINLLLPIITLELSQAILRYAIADNSEENHSKIFGIFIINAIFLSLILMISFPILNKLNILDGYLGLFVSYFILSIFNTYYSQFIRGIGLVKEYVISGILMTIVTVISNIILLVFMDLGILGYFLSMIFAQFISLIYFAIVTKSVLYIKKFRFDFKLFKSMINYSYPLIPNTSLLWLINSATRYFILYFIGSSANGLFAIANKIPQILALITNIFSQAWQLSSFEEVDSPDTSEFYSKILSIYSTALFLGSSTIMVVIKPFMSIFVDAAFYESWTLIPVLLYGIIYQSINGFLGTIYTSIMNTKGVFTSSFLGMIIAMGSNVIFIPTIGLQGAGIGTLLGYFSMTVIRYIDTQKYINLKINFKEFILTNLIYIVQIILLFYIDSYLSILSQITLVILMFILLRNNIQPLILIIQNKIKK